MKQLIENHLDDLARKSKLTDVYTIEYKEELINKLRSGTSL